jgi:hypothetical protein
MMENSTPSETPPSRPVPFLQSPNFRIIYANGFSFKPSTTDFGVTFLTQIVIPGELPDGSQGNVITNMQEMTVMMALPWAKAFTENLGRLIAEIEKQTGEIRTATGSLITEEQLSGVAATLKAGALK